MTTNPSRSYARGHRGIRLNPSIHDAAPANTPVPSGPPTIHPAADLFPLIDGADFDALVLDIATNGLREPIVLIGNQIIDGRNRLRACEAAGITPRYREIQVPDPVAYIVSANIHRRHLTTQQRAAIAAELANQQHGGDRKSEAIKGSKDHLIKEAATSIEDAAKLLKVSTASVKRAKQRLRNDPSAHAAVKRGEKPISKQDAKNAAAHRRLVAEKLREIGELKAEIAAAELYNAEHPDPYECALRVWVPIESSLDEVQRAISSGYQSGVMPPCPPVVSERLLPRWAAISQFFSSLWAEMPS